MSGKPSLLVVSHVLPFPGNAGQQQRVANKLSAFRTLFDVTFLTYAPENQRSEIEQKLRDHCDSAIVLPSKHVGLSRYWHSARGALFALLTGLKSSNYAIGQVELSPERVRQAIGSNHYDMVVYEYWHATASTEVFRQRHMPTALDMHDVLWQSYQRQLDLKARPAWWKKWAVRQYQRAEEAAWKAFDILIAINRAEGDYARTIVGAEMPILYAPMGTDLSKWPYCWQPASPPRVAYYGGLGSPHNQLDAARVYSHIMPHIWESAPDTQYWIVGSNPPQSLKDIAAKDSRVIVTGFVERAQDVISTMTAVLCPWTGTYGFRSRLVEVMGLGVPVVASPDAVYGMEMEEGRGIFLREGDQEMAEAALRLIQQPDFAQEQSRFARQQMEQKYSYEATYGKLARNLLDYTQIANSR